MKSILKNLVNAVLFRIIKLLVRTQLILQFNLGLIQTYAPNPFSSKKLKKNDKRESLKRFQAITKFLPKNKSLTTIDIGCNLGFFTFSMAKKYRGLSIGIDYGRNEILAAKALATKYSVDNILFIQREVTDKNAYLLPKTDVVICLSIYHHWIRKLGQKKSYQIMEGLTNSTKKYLIFDTGQPNEKNVEWNKYLNFMSPNYKKWARKYFISLGFKKVVFLGEFKTSVSDVPRELLIAIK